MAEINFRDPIHNFMTFTGDEVRLVNTNVIQRLRGIRQLALASLVYPGALHTRFDHTLGVAHVAGQMADALGLDHDDRNIVRLAALLHDIGHGPFSHVSEYALERFGDRASLPPALKKDKIHEVITGHIIRTDPVITQTLGQDACNRVAQLLSVGGAAPILKSIVSGPLDADKQDYLLRDSHFAGVNYGLFDIRQLHRSMVSIQIGNQNELLIRSSGVHAIEQFVMAKYYLTSMVYRHKVRLITDQMIVRAIVLGIEKDRIRELSRLYRFKNEGEFYANYLSWNDARFMQQFGADGKPQAKCTHIINRLASRNLFKRIFHLPIKAFPSECRENLLQITKKDSVKMRIEIETEISAIICAEFGTAIDSDFVILHTYQIKSVRESSRNDESSILVDRGNQSFAKFEDQSVLFLSINERFADEYVEVYAPVSWDNHADRTRHIDKIHKVIEDLISAKTKSDQKLLSV